MQAILTREPLRLNGDGDGGVNVVSPGKKLGNVIYRGACRDPNPAARGDAVNRVNHPRRVVSRILYFEKKESFRLLLFDSGNGRSKIEFIEFVYIYIYIKMRLLCISILCFVCPSFRDIAS